MAGRRSGVVAVAGAAAALLVVAAACWTITRGAFVAEPPVRPPADAWFVPQDTDSALVWAVGNGADGRTAARTVARRIGDDDPDAFLYLGDVYATSWARRLAFGEGDAHDFSKSYDSVYGRLAADTAPTPGNHEWRRRADGYEAYWGDVHGAPVPSWYAFELAGWEVLMLNSEAPHHAGSAQVEWLRRQVGGPGGRCRIAAWHEARYSAARTGGDQPDLAPLWEALAGHATLVLNAHDHAMQRLEPIDGITPMVIGSGGHGHHALDHDDPRLAFGDDERYGALRLEIEPGRLRWQFVSSPGTVLDAGDRSCVGR